MCHYRQVNKVYSACGHTVVLPDELIVCYGTNCRFSPHHRKDCRPPACLNTCWQYRLSPERYSLRINGHCPACSQQ